MAKYHNKKAIADGISFDSTKEMRRYKELKLMQSAGEISGLELQRKFVLIPAQFETTLNKHGRPVKKCVERECSYVADFVYDDKDKNTHVEDVKGMKTRDYIIKRKLMRYIFGIAIEEV